MYSVHFCCRVTSARWKSLIANLWPKHLLSGGWRSANRQIHFSPCYSQQLPIDITPLVNVILRDLQFYTKKFVKIYTLNMFLNTFPHSVKSQQRVSKWTIWGQEADVTSSGNEINCLLSSPSWLQREAVTQFWVETLYRYHETAIAFMQTFKWCVCVWE